MIRRFGTMALLLVLSAAPVYAADAQNQCDAHSKLPKHLSHILFKGADGESCDQPVIIEKARNTAEGVAAEKAWMSACQPSARTRAKAITHKEDKVYEVVEISLEDNTVRRVCFDITGFFGTW